MINQEPCFALETLQAREQVTKRSRDIIQNMVVCFICKATAKVAFFVAHFFVDHDQLPGRSCKLTCSNIRSKSAPNIGGPELMAETSMESKMVYGGNFQILRKLVPPIISSICISVVNLLGVVRFCCVLIYFNIIIISLPYSAPPSAFPVVPVVVVVVAKVEVVSVGH